MTLRASLLRELVSPNLSVGDRVNLCCEQAKEFENKGEYEEAREVLRGLWPDIDQRPDLSGLEPSTAAEVLLRAGVLILDMADEVRDVEVQLADNEIVPAKLFIWDEAPEDRDLVKLILQFRGKQISSIDPSYFGALCSIRKILEVEGALLRCYGASKNVYPSGMSMDMGGGYKAYKLTMGSQAKLMDLVSIFDTGPDVTPATVDEQRKFYDAWLASLG